MLNVKWRTCGFAAELQWPIRKRCWRCVCVCVYTCDTCLWTRTPSSSGTSLKSVMSTRPSTSLWDVWTLPSIRYTSAIAPSSAGRRTVFVWVVGDYNYFWSVGRKERQAHKRTHWEAGMFRSQTCHREVAVTSGGSRGRSEQRWTSPPLCSGREGASPPDRTTIKQMMLVCYSFIWNMATCETVLSQVL